MSSPIESQTVSPPAQQLSAGQKKKLKEKAKKEAAKLAAAANENAAPGEAVDAVAVAKARAMALARGGKKISKTTLAEKKAVLGEVGKTGKGKTRMSKKDFEKVNYAAGSLCA